MTQTLEPPAPSADAFVRTVVTQRASRGTIPATSPAPVDVQWLAGDLSRASLGEWLRQQNAADRFDANTILRALGPDVATLAVKADETRVKARPELTIVISLEQRANSPVVCLDVERLGGVDAALRWLEVTATPMRDRSKAILIAAVGRGGEDLSRLGRLVDGVVARPSNLGREAFERAIAPLLKGLRDPAYADALAPAETHGGVSAQEFEETIAQAAMPDADSRKRD